MPPKIKVPFNKDSHQNKLDNLKSQNNSQIFSENLDQNSHQKHINQNLEAEEKQNTNNFDPNNLANFSNFQNMQSNHTNQAEINTNPSLNTNNLNNFNPEIEKLQNEINNLKSKNEEMTNRIFRMAADAQNAIKQEEITLGQTRKQTKKSTLNLILPFLDTLYLSFAFVPETDDEKMQKFIQTLQNSFEKLISDLNLNGIELIIPKENDMFDPQTMMPLNSPNAQEEITKENIQITRMVSLGVKIDGQVVRSASIMF